MVHGPTRHPWKKVWIPIVGVCVAAASMLLGCAAVDNLTAGSIAFTVDLAQAYEQGVTIDGVAAALTSASDGTVREKTLAIDSTAQKATGSVSSIPPGTYTIDLTVSSGSEVLGKGTQDVTVRAGDSLAMVVTVVISAPSEPDNGVGVSIQ